MADDERTQRVAEISPVEGSGNGTDDTLESGQRQMRFIATRLKQYEPLSVHHGKYSIELRVGKFPSQKSSDWERFRTLVGEVADEIQTTIIVRAKDSEATYRHDFPF